MRDRLRPHFEIVDWTKFDPDDGGMIPAQRSASTAAATAGRAADRQAATGRQAEKMKAVLHTIGAQTVEPPSAKEETGDEINSEFQETNWRGANAPRSSLARACAMPIGVYDIETRSTVNLTLCGAWKYAAHPSTSILCMYIAVDDGEPERWLPGDPIPAAFIAAAQHPDDWKLIAHNHEFERAIYELILMPRFGFPPIPLTVQHCTQQLASRNAYPAELGLLSQALGLPYRKDREAAKAMRELSRPRKPRRGEDRNQIYWVEDEAKRQLVFERCRLDVITTRAVWTHPKLRHPSVAERHCQVLDATINRRGIRLDRGFVEAAQTLAIQERNAINLRLAQLTAGSITSVDQVKRFVELINAHGHAMTTLNKRGVAAVLASKPDAFVRELLELRRKGARASARKFARMLMYASEQDDRLRGTLRWHGGGPGRWVGLGPQLHNLDRNDLGVPLEAIELVRTGDRARLAQYGNPLTLIGSLARGAICAAPGHEFLIFDYSSIESRVLAWLAGETWKLDAYREFDSSGDKRIEPYRIIASKMLGKDLDAISKVDRQTGKIGELSAGFGGSVGAWRRQIADDRSDAAIKADIEKWRRAHPRVVKFWHDLARCIRIAIKTGQSVYVGTPPGPTITAQFRSREFVSHPAVGTLDHLSRSAPGAVEVRGLSARRHVQGQRAQAVEGDARLARNLHRECGAGDRARHPGGGDRADGGPRPTGGLARARRPGGRSSDRHRHSRRIPTARIGAGALGRGIAIGRQGPGRALLSGRAGRAATAAARQRDSHRRDGARQLSRRRARHRRYGRKCRRGSHRATKAKTMMPFSTISIRTALRSATSSRCH